MGNHFRIAVPLALVLALVTGATPRGARADEPAKHYVCRPCGLPCDATVFDKPGVCPKCGMALVDQASVVARTDRTSVGILVFDGVEIIDYTGPWEVFGSADFRVYTVAASKDPITTAMGMNVVPNYSFADAPQPDILVVPGGGVRAARSDAGTLNWVRGANQKTKITMSVCNGAFILASAGLLDGLAATTTAKNIPAMRSEFPKVKVVDDQRWVDNGRIVTAAGLSAGIDGALHVVERLRGRGTAQNVALSEEYDWQTHSQYARAALADLLIPEIREEDLAASGDWEIVSTEGGRERWDVAFRGPSKLRARDLFDKLCDVLTTRGRWNRVEAASGVSPAPQLGHWKIHGRDGQEWTGTMSVADDTEGANRYVVAIHVARAGP